MLDVHSHILPNVDDGSDSIETSILMLEMMKSQGITDVIATPHFYAFQDNLDEFKAKITEAFSELKNAINGKNLPNIYLGCEVLYFPGISVVDDINSFCINNSNYLLLELPNNCINSRLFDDISTLKRDLDIIPIIAHVERYYRYKGFKKLIEFATYYRIPLQINATSVAERPYNRITHKLLKMGYVKYLGTDAHSVDVRPPQMDIAINKIEQKYGNAVAKKLIENSKRLLSSITNTNNGDI